MTITTEQAPPPDAPAPSPPRRRRIVFAVVALAALLAGGWWLFVRDDDPDSGLPDAATGSVGSLPPAATMPPDAEAASLEELLEKGRSLTFHATYDSSGDPELLGGELTIEVWRKDGRIRQDTTLVRPDGTIRSAGFVLGEDTITCSKQGDAPWSCSRAEDPGTTEDGVFGSVAAQLAGADVTQSDDTVAGRAARCFTFPTGEGATGEGTGRMCLTSDGMPLLLASGGQELVLVDVQPDVDDAVFEPPAEP